MGREVRRVPADWQHPKEQKPDWRTGRMVEGYKPLFPGERYQPAVDEWDEECAMWKAGWRPDYCTDAENRAKAESARRIADAKLLAAEQAFQTSSVTDLTAREKAERMLEDAAAGMGTKVLLIVRPIYLPS